VTEIVRQHERAESQRDRMVKMVGGSFHRNETRKGEQNEGESDGTGSGHLEKDSGRKKESLLGGIQRREYRARQRGFGGGSSVCIGTVSGWESWSCSGAGGVKRDPDVLSPLSLIEERR